MRFKHVMYRSLSEKQPVGPGDNYPGPDVDRNDPDQLPLARKTLSLR
jgi:hypothetical protein